MSNVQMKFAVTNNDDGSEHNTFTWSLPNLNAERLGEVTEYGDKVQKMVTKVDKPGGNLKITLSGSIDGVAVAPISAVLDDDGLHKVEDVVIDGAQKLLTNEKARKAKKKGKGGKP